jgi:IS30 family transposase
VSREISRHGGRPAYRAHVADHHAWDSALRPKKCLLAVNRKLRNIVASKLILDWSPEHICGWLKMHYADDESMRVSHETVYRSLFIQARGVLKKELMDHLRSKRRMRRSRHATVLGQSRGQIVDAISIRERPPEVKDRAIPGHWEGDLLSGAKNSYIATLVERHSRFAMLIKVPSKDTEVVVAALSQHVRKLPATLRRSLTWDRGLEMAKHKTFTVATDVKVYFCDPQSPWQRGTNENTNLLLRQYFPRGTEVSAYSQAQLDQVALRLNERPRKTLGQKMNRYNELKLKVLSLFAATPGEWLSPNEAAEELDFFPARSAWTYFKRLWGFSLLERRSRGRGTLEYRISELGRSRLRSLCSQRG